MLGRRDGFRLCWCWNCGQLWRLDEWLDEWDKYQTQFAIKMARRLGWQELDITPLRREYLIQSHGGQTDRFCNWPGCRGHRVNGFALCADHLLGVAPPTKQEAPAAERARLSNPRPWVPAPLPECIDGYFDRWVGGDLPIEVEAEVGALLSSLRVAGWTVSLCGFSAHFLGDWYVDLHRENLWIQLTRDDHKYLVHGPPEEIEAAGLRRTFLSLEEFRQAIIEWATKRHQ